MPVATTIPDDPIASQSAAPGPCHWVAEKEPPAAAAENPVVHLKWYLGQKQRFLDASSKRFHENVEKAHETMDYFADTMKEKVEEMRIRLRKQLEAKHARRLGQVDDERKTLKELQGQLQQLLAGGDGTDVPSTLATIRQRSDKCLGSTTTEDFDAYASIYVQPSQMYVDYMACPPNCFFGVCSIVQPDIFKLRMVTADDLGVNDGQVWMEVFAIGVDRDRVPNRCPKTLLSEFSFGIEGNNQKVSVDFREMWAANNIIVREDGGFFFKLHSTMDLKGDVVVHVKFCEVEVLGSPQILSVRNNKSFRTMTMPENVVRWQENEHERLSVSFEGRRAGQQIMNFLSTGRNDGELDDLQSKFKQISMSGNVTRTGKNSSDLDESDMRAMDMTNKASKGGLTTVQEVTEEDNASTLQDPTTVTDAVARLQQQQQLSSAVCVAKVVASPSVFHTELISSSAVFHRQLPLDCPSPLGTPIAFPKSGDEMTSDLPGKKSFAPGISSTVNNLGGDLKNINVPILALEEANDMLEVDPTADVSMLQKNLSGEDAQHHQDSKNKSVSFHPDIDLQQKMKLDNTLALVKRNEKKMNNTLKELILGRGQNGDPELTLVKLNRWREDEEDYSRNGPSAALQQQSNNSYKEDSCWNDSDGKWERRQKEAKEKCDRNRPIILGESQWSIIDDDDLQYEPYFDLSSSGMTIYLNKSFPVEGVPQSVSRHLAEGMDLMLVADAANNRIHKFAGWKSLGVWQPKWAKGEKRKFVMPRSVLCLPDDRVAVLDDKAIYIFMTDGKLLKTLFDGETTNFRGLAFHNEWGQLITTEVKDNVVNLLFVDVLTNKGVVNTIPMEPTRDNPDARIRYVAYRAGSVYATDLFLGQYYVTNLEKKETSVYTYTTCGTNKLKNAAGVAVDPAGNVLVASAYHKTIEVFNSEGMYFRSLSLGDKVEKPTGIWLHGYRLLVVDSDRNTLNVFMISEC